MLLLMKQLTWYAMFVINYGRTRTVHEVGSRLKRDYNHLSGMEKTKVPVERLLMRLRASDTNERID